MIKRNIFTVLCIVSMSGSAFAGCGEASNRDSCQDSLRCTAPISRGDCTDPYCFAIPSWSHLTQAQCCQEFGNVGMMTDTNDTDYNEHG